MKLMVNVLSSKKFTKFRHLNLFLIIITIIINCCCAFKGFQYHFVSASAALSYIETSEQRQQQYPIENYNLVVIQGVYVSQTTCMIFMKIGL